MKHFIAYILFMFTSVGAIAQVDVKGVVIDDKSKEPLTGASIIMKGADNTIKKFAISDKDGTFFMTVASVAGCRLEISMMGFEKKNITLDNTSFPITIKMTYGAVQLKEVKIKA